MKKLLWLLAACAGGPASGPTAAVAPKDIEIPAATAPTDGAGFERAGDLARAETAYAASDNVFALARVQMLQGKYDAADATLQKARAAKGETAEIMNALSTLSRVQRNYPQAIASAKRVLLRDAANTQAHVNIAMAHYEQGKLDAAEAYLGTVLARLPKAAPLYVTLGLVQVKRGQAGLAMASFKKALELEATNAAARVNAGFLALAYRDYRLAHTYLDAAVQQGAVTKEVQAARCYALEGTRQGEPAAQCFTELLARQGLSDGDRAAYYYALGNVHQTLTRKNKAALDAYRRYVELKGSGLGRTDKVFGVIKKLEASEETAKPGSQAAVSGETRG